MFSGKQIRAIYLPEALVDLFKQNLKLDRKEQNQRQPSDQTTSIILPLYTSQETLPLASPCTQTEPLSQEKILPSYLPQETLPREIEAHIFQFLPIESLTTVENVCKGWKDSISQDYNLKEKLNEFKGKAIDKRKKEAQQFVKEIIQNFIWSTCPSIKRENIEQLTYSEYLVHYSLKLRLSQFVDQRAWFVLKINQQQDSYHHYVSHSDDDEIQSWILSCKFHQKDQPDLISLTISAPEALKDDPQINLSQKTYTKCLKIYLNFMAEKAWKQYYEQPQKNNEKHPLLWIKNFANQLESNRDLIDSYLKDEKENELIAETIKLREKRLGLWISRPSL